MSDGIEASICRQILDLANKIEQLIESHKELTDHISKIKEAIYHPDDGIYSRIRELERDIITDGNLRISKAEETLESVKRLQWMVVGCGVAAIISVIFKTFVLTG